MKEIGDNNEKALLTVGSLVDDNFDILRLLSPHIDNNRTTKRKNTHTHLVEVEHLIYKRDICI